MLELHLTTTPITATRSGSFAELCKSLGGKALVIELSRGLHGVQPMATFHIPGSVEQAQAAAESFSCAYLDAGFSIVRRKIEFDLHETRLPQPEARYFEWHGRVNVADGELEYLRALCEPSDAHLSHNALRRAQHRFITIRAGAVPKLEAGVAKLRSELTTAGWAIERERWEGVAFDSNLQLDQGWL